jgi:hypothetical protein
MPQKQANELRQTQNIARFKALLDTEEHPDKRQILIQLLADEEEAKHAARIGRPARLDLAQRAARRRRSR